MSLIIQGMDMPLHTNPGNGWSQNISDVYVVIDSDDSVYLHYKGKRYLLKEIPTPHGDLVDRDILHECYESLMEEPDSVAFTCLTADIDQATPVIDAEN